MRDKLRATVTMRKTGDGISIWSSVRQDRQVLIKDGKYTASGAANLRQQRCGT